MRPLRKRPRRRSSPGEARPCDGMRKIHAHAAGVDIGAHASMACGPDGDDHQLGRAVGTYTADLGALADGVVARGLQTAAMEATGGDWMPLCEGPGVTGQRRLRAIVAGERDPRPLAA